MDVPKILMEIEMKENLRGVTEYLRLNGVYITSKGKIHQTQIKKALELIKRHIRYKLMDLTDLSKIVE